MDFKYYMPTRVIFGYNCISNESKEIVLGKRAMIITGANSAKLSGALQDVVKALEKHDVEYGIFDGIENNPSLENVALAARAAAEFKAEFIIGIGGGSPMDAAKAVAVLAVNDIPPIELFDNNFYIKPLPVIAVPTTSGTGSEVTPYSIITRKDIKTKMSFGNKDTFPVVSFLDPDYIKSQPFQVVADTSMDAFSHALEGYLNKKSTMISDFYALEAIRIFKEVLDNLKSGKINDGIWEKLMYMAMMAGVVIAHTGTTLIHGLGYSLTYFKGISHGRANGILIREYLKYNYPVAREKIDRILEGLDIESIDKLGQIINDIMPVSIDLEEDDLRNYAAITVNKKNISNNLRRANEEDLYNIMKNTFFS